MGDRARSRRVESLHDSPHPLWQAYDVAMLDLDGVVYRGASPVPSAPELLSDLRTQGLRQAFVTNNASRPPAEVARQLRQMGIAAGS